MLHLRQVIYLAAAAGIGGYLSESISEKQRVKKSKINKGQSKKQTAKAEEPSVTEQLKRLFSTTTGQLYKSIAMKYQNNVAAQNCTFDPQPNVSGDADAISRRKHICKNKNSKVKMSVSRKFKVRNQKYGSAECCKLPVAAKLPTSHPLKLHVLPIPENPTRSYRDYGKDCQLIFDTRTKTPFWTVEKITKKNVKKAEHRHPEEIVVQFNLPDGFQFGNPDNKRRFSVKHLSVPIEMFACQSRLSGFFHHRKKSCKYCQQSGVWNVFHQYIKFLTNHYDTVFVCTGLLYLEEPKRYDSFPTKELIPTHYFKVISCKNSNGTYRLECYKFKINDRSLNLKNYLVSREELERDTGFIAFAYFPKCMVTDTTTHPCFCYHPSSPFHM